MLRPDGATQHAGDANVKTFLLGLGLLAFSLYNDSARLKVE
jgi:hypothetical protein